MSNQKGQLNFQTVPGRQKTKKWTTAPSYNYDGDEWGGYDEWEEPAPPPLPAQAPYGTQQLPSQQQSGLTRGRNTSFDRGDERRQFSASTPASAFPAYEERRPSRGPASASSTGRGSNDIPRSGSRPRDFTNPEQAPPPLQTRAAPASPAPNEWFPPRKSSLKGGTYETAAAAAEARAIAESVSQSSSPSSDKPLPFIRPSDIYKRIPEEMRRQSQEGSRPSMESLQRETSPSHPILTPVAEARESRLFTDADIPKIEDRPGNVSSQPKAAGSATQSQGNVRETSPTLPPVERFSGFGDDFLSGGARSTGPNNSNTTGQDSAVGQNGASATSTPGGNTTNLQHQPSAGFRSAVHQAFDRSDDSPSISRDGSQSGPGEGGVSRSDTTSTAGISPIMSRVPSGATAQLRQQPRLDEQVPSIAEEPSTAASSRTVSGVQGAHAIPRKPSPGGHSRNVSGETPADFTPGYRRSLDPPSSGTSPARTPALETTAARRLSTPMSAVPMTDSDSPDVVDQGAEVPEATLYPAETPASEISDFGSSNAPTKPLPIAGRGRSGTDYSTREADIADTMNSSPDKGVSSPSIAQAQRDSQKQFLEQHATPISEVSPAARDGFRPQTGTPTHGSRSGSPAKGRVREMAENINNASRRNSATSMHSSKSSWSQFDKPTISRQGTAQSQAGIEPTPARPELGREESFKPDLPGGWISTAPTPALESPPPQSSPSTAREATPQPETPIDLTPTTKKYQLQSGPVASGPVAGGQSAFEAAKSAGEQLGASLLSTVGMGHQTRDFASTAPAAPVDQPEMQPRAATGELTVPPPMMRFQSDSDAATSVASSVAPTPPAKDTPKGDMLGVTGGSGGYFNTVAPLRIRSREPSPEHLQSTGQAPVLPAISTDSHPGDMDSDRLRKEIVRSLDPMATHETPRASMDDIERTQDALDAPENERKMGQGLPATHAAAATAASRPGFLDTRFSWEGDKSIGSASQTTQAAPEPASPEIKPETAYERPRSRQLHVVNAAVSPVSPQDKPATSLESSVAGGGLAPAVPLSASTDTNSLISPITRSQEHLAPESSFLAGGSTHSLADVAPSPISDRAESISTRLPSYYLGDHDPVLPDAPEKDHTNSSTLSQPSSPAQVKTSAPLPPFKNILNMKSSDERIKTYNTTRQTFADMDTGLSDWLAKMIEQHPEHAGLAASGSRPPPLQTQTSNFKRGHKPSPSIAKFTDQFRTTSGQRTASMGSEGESAARPTTGGAGADGSRIDMDCVQQQMKQSGKDFMKNASVFGGKASSGAKGLFAKGKSRFAGGSVRGKPNSNYEVPSSNASARDGGAKDVRPVTSPSPLPTITTLPVVSLPDEPVPMRSSNDMTQSPASDVPTPITAIPIAKPADEVSKDNMPSAENTSEDHKVHLHDAAEKSIESPISTSQTAVPVIAPPASADISGAHFNSGSANLDIATKDLPSRLTEKSAAPPSTDVPTHITANHIAALAANEPPALPVTVATPPPATRESSTGSPFRRPRSQTPSSSRASSRPLSQVFERLREKTRSVSRSTTTSERRKADSSRSRPTSMILTNNESAESTAPDLPEPTEFKVMGVRSTQRGVESWEGERPAARRSSTTPILPGHGRRAMSMAMPIRTEAWNEPDVELPPKTPDARSSSSVGRLGVLPSPAPTLLTFEDAGMSRRASLEVAKRRESNAPIGGWREGWGGEELGTVESRGESLEDEDGSEKKPGPQSTEVEEAQEPPAAEQPAPIRRGSDLATLPSQQASRPTTGKERIQTAWVKEEDESDASPTRPQGRYFIANAVPKDEQVSQSPSPVQQHKRRISDLATLPSQQGNSPLNVGRPDSQVLVPLKLPSKESIDIEEASPVTIKQRSPTFATDGLARAKEQDDLYDTTPVASKAPWRVASTGHEKDIEQMERDIAQVAATTGAEPDVSRPTTSEQFEDARSEVSAEEGAAREDDPSEKLGRTSSRRSSVSSLGDLGDAEKAMLAAGTAEPTLMPDEARRLVMSAQAAPAGPTIAETRQAEQQTQAFANRSYRAPHMHDRPLSYAPLPRDRQGLIREQITTDAENKPIPVSPVQVDIGGMAGPPTGTPPFQQHPVFRAQGPGDYEQVRNSMVSPGHTPNSSVDVTAEKRKSGFFRSRKSSAVETRIPSGVTPTASRIGDDHGLEGLHDMRTETPEPFAQPQQQQTEAEQKQARRGSGIWNALSRRSSRGGARPGSSTDTSLATIGNERPVSRSQPLDKVREEPVGKPKTLRKTQRDRAVSGTADEEGKEKKKRFSKFGSFFGRSNTTASPDNSREREKELVKDKPNRLSKKSGPGDVRRSETVQERAPDNFGTVSGSVRGYEAYEAARRRDGNGSAWQENQSRRTPQPAVPTSTRTEGIQPPADGWYGPSSRQSEEQPPVSPTTSRPQQPTSPQPLPEFRRLHSSGQGHRGSSRPMNQVADQRALSPRIPEAFQPVQASYNQPIQPIGPPPGHEPPYIQGPGGPVAHRVPTGAPPRERQTSYGSDVSQLSRQVSGQMGSVSPMQQNVYAPPPMRSQMPSDPYAGQVSGGFEEQRARAASWSERPAEQFGPPRSRMASPPQQPYQQQQYVGRPPSQGQGPYPPTQQQMPPMQGQYQGSPPPQGPPRPIPWEDIQPMRSPPPQSQNQQGPYPAPARSFTAPVGPQHVFYQQQQQQQQQRSPPPTLNRYYAQQQAPPQRRTSSGPAPQDPFSPQQQAPYQHNRRRSSGYTGRRDDPAVGEDEVDMIMRGASYPGQEWQPGAGGHQSWD